MRAATLITVGAIVAILFYLIDNALPALSWEFFSESPREMMTTGGIWPCIVGTFYLAVGATVIALPLGVASALYLTEYGGQGRFVSGVRLAVSNLSGVPSVIFGFFGLTFFVTFCGFGVSLLSGLLTGNILALSRVAGETAAIMYTAAVFYTPTMTHSVMDPVMSLPYHIYVLATSSVDVEASLPLQYGTTFVLVLMVLCLNAVALTIRSRAQKRLARQ